MKVPRGSRTGFLMFRISILTPHNHMMAATCSWLPDPEVNRLCSNRKSAVKRGSPQELELGEEEIVQGFSKMLLNVSETVAWVFKLI